MGQAALPAAIFLLLVAVWQAVAQQGLVDPMILPAPHDIARNLAEGIRSGLFLRHLGVTLLQVVLGLLLAVFGGVGAASVAALSARLGRALRPLLIAIEATPKIALAPVIIVWFGYGTGSKIVLAALIAFFPIFISTMTGLQAAEPGRLDVLRALGANRLQIFRLVRLPGALPHIFAGLQVAIVFALLGTIVGEFMGAKSGLGTLIIYANENLDTARVFSILLLLAVTGVVLQRSIVLLRRRLLFWE